MSKFSLRAALVAAAGILITIGGCAESPSTPGDLPAAYRVIPAPASASFARAGSDDRSSAVIGAGGGMLQTSTGHRIVFPAGALGGPTEISIRTATIGVGVELEPHGIVFPAGREPILTLNTSSLDLSGYNDVAVGYVNESGVIAEVLPTNEIGNATKLQARLPHFSIFTTVGT